MLNKNLFTDELQMKSGVNMQTFPVISSRTQQQGAVLVVSLIILLVMTIIGITGMRTTVLEEKMASNSFDRNTAFQAAEVALRAGENLANSLVTTSSFDGTAGRLGPSDTDPDWWASATWSSSNSIAYTGTTLSDVHTQPRYIVKFIGQIASNNGSLKARNYGDLGANMINEFRVTARGTGRSDSSQSILQTYYGKPM